MVARVRESTNTGNTMKRMTAVRATLLLLPALALGTPAEEDVYRVDTHEVQVQLPNVTLHVRTDTGEVREEGQRPRFLLRVANWLHLNRGKKAWTYAADAYAAGLLTLALTGLFMIPGRKGLVGRGALLVAAGVALPVLYVTLSGGP